MAYTIHLAAAAVALAILGGGALAAAQMGVGPFNDGTQNHPAALIGGHGQEHGPEHASGQDHCYRHGMHTREDEGHGEGMKHGDKGMSRECRHDHRMEHAHHVTSVNATITGVDMENRTVVVDTGENESLTLRVKRIYTDTSTGYLASGYWLMLQLEPGATVTVIVPENISSIAPLLGIEVGSTLYVTPGLEPVVAGGMP